MPITTGPILVSAALNQAFALGPITNLDPNSQTLTLCFDHPVTITDAAGIFRTTPELSKTGVVLNKATHGRFVIVTRTSGQFLEMYPGIAKVWLAAGDIRWSAWTGNNNQMAQKVETTNDGPALIAAYYNDKGTVGDATDDEVWLTFSEPINPASLDSPDTQYVLGWGCRGLRRRAPRRRLQPLSASYTNTLVVSNPGAGPARRRRLDHRRPRPGRPAVRLPEPQRRPARGLRHARRRDHPRGLLRPR